MDFSCVKRVLAAIVAIMLLGSSLVHGDDLSTFQCTANDVNIVGPGQVINEPCTCTGTFTAKVQFTVSNTAASARGCITLHLCPITLPDGSIFAPNDIRVLPGSLAGKDTQVVTVDVTGYPCNAGLLCFGVVPTGNRCGATPDTCCSTVSWTVPGQDTCPPTKQISSKCRHEQICIQSRSTTLTCTGETGSPAYCPVQCGGSGSFTLCSSCRLPNTTFSLAVGTTTFTDLSGDLGTPNCHTFDVSSIPESGTATGTVVDYCSGTRCEKQVSLPVTVTNPHASVTFTLPSSSGCPNGALTFTASSTGCPTGSTRTYEFFVDGVSKQVGTGTTFDYSPPDSVTGILACHHVTVKVTCGGCTSPESDAASFKQCITSAAC